MPDHRLKYPSHWRSVLVMAVWLAVVAALFKFTGGANWAIAV
jgi:hypothetical protein